jgi:hypothetical protein
MDVDQAGLRMCCHAQQGSVRCAPMLRGSSVSDYRMLQSKHHVVIVQNRACLEFLPDLTDMDNLFAAEVSS